MRRSRRTSSDARRCPAGSRSSSSDVLPSRFGKAQQAPIEGAFLAIVLAQAARDGGLHEFLAEIERVRGVVNIKLVEHRVHVGLADETLCVERVQPVGV